MVCRACVLASFDATRAALGEALISLNSRRSAVLEDQQVEARLRHVELAKLQSEAEAHRRRNAKIQRQLLALRHHILQARTAMDERKLQLQSTVEEVR